MPPKLLNKDGDQNKQKGKTGSRNSSRHNSLNTPVHLNDSTSDENESWNCTLCSKVFSERNAKLLECQRCSAHYCIKCLNKSVAEYDILSKSDTMWFCPKCREVVEKNIVKDLEIEKRCKEIMATYEQRITTLEHEIARKCDESTVRQIVNEELSNANASAAKTDIAEGGSVVTSVIGEINERKTREKNIVIYESQEIESKDKKQREQYDIEVVKQVFEACDLRIDNNKSSKSYTYWQI
jgi:hypothetical protein